MHWLRGKGLTPVVASGGMKNIKESGSLLNLLIETYENLLKL